MKTAKFAQAASIYVNCAYCGSSEVVGKASGSMLVTYDDGTCECLDCGKEMKIPVSPFKVRGR